MKAALRVVSGATGAERRAAAPDADGSRQRIHGAARRLFALRGFDGVSLQQIADEVGLHKSSLFHHYRGKVDLAREVFDAAIARIADAVAPLSEEDPPRLATLLAIADTLVDHFSDEPEAARLLLMQMTTPPGAPSKIPVSMDVDQPTVRFYSSLWQWLDRARACGAIRELNVRQTIMNLVGLVLFYPAVATTEREVAGPQPFSAKARAVRKTELRFALRGMLDPATR